MKKINFLVKKIIISLCVAPKGSLSNILGQLWHQIGKNFNNDRRWAILIHYKRWWIKPSTDFTKCGTKSLEN